ncbi:MAG TPA: hypothetical protein VIG76_13655 [Amnibacterium sp.]|jgi:hypothetical protein|uniref:DUF6197 family protein n=1 Tax=Amnibacterium sp. TaxID=1872496 RepID=UPI002F92C79A
MTVLHGLLTERSRARAERRRLESIDRATARLAVLALTSEALTVAGDVVSRGWLQDTWFAWRDADGRELTAGSSAAHTVPLDAVTRACLVGALVVGAGGTTSQVLRPAVEATWRGVHGGGEALRWQRSPEEAAVQVRELTAWNDRAGRDAEQVTALLASAVEAVERERASARDGLVALTR